MPHNVSLDVLAHANRAEDPVWQSGRPAVILTNEPWKIEVYACLCSRTCVYSARACPRDDTQMVDLGAATLPFGSRWRVFGRY